VSGDQRAGTRRELGIADGKRLLLVSEEMVRGSGHKHASWAHAILRQIIQDLVVVMPGGGPVEANVRYFAGTTGYDGEVFFCGERFSRPALLAACDIVLLVPDRPVGVSGLAAAMAAGKPIVASALPDLAEYAPDGQAALLCPPADPLAIAAAILRLIDDPSLARRLAKTAQQAARRQFDLAACRARLEEIHQAAGRPCVS
jgi:glycosyltransferase involved in cell wall biosynthesis